jgi:hypothetical protein
MAKTKTLVELAKSKPIQKAGAKEWHNELTPAQQKEFFEFMDWMKSGNPGRDRPCKRQAMEQVNEYFKTKITQHTFDKYFNAR